MSRHLRQPLTWILKANLIALVIDFIFLAFLALVFNFDAVVLVRASYFPKMLLLEAGVVFLVGGAIAFSSSIFGDKVKELVFRSEEKWSMEKLKKGEKRANLYILVGILLFLESILTSFLIF
jgi:hypothetical protein